MLTLLLATLTIAADLPEWPGFAGPNRNWSTNSRGLAATWPATGPKKLWSRALGEGYSGIAVDNGVLYTMYRRGDEEVVAALDAKSGKTIWEHPYEAKIRQGMGMENGPGPHSTPLVVGDRVFAVGILAHLFAFNKKTGKVIWEKDLYKDFSGSSFMGRGYACSPLAYKDNIILSIGGAGHAVVALKQSDGSTAWATADDYLNAPSSPSLIKLDGQDQIVAFLNDKAPGDVKGIIAGIDPNNGKILWTHPHPTNWGLNIALPVWGDDRILFISCAYSGGSRALQLTRQGDKTIVKELWHNNNLRNHHGTMFRIDDLVYGSSGDFGPAPLSAVNVKTGELKWRERGFPKANFVYADGKFIILDEDGNLSLTQLSPEGVKVLSKTPLLERISWTAPSLAGKTLYVRDRRSIMALELP